VRSMERGESVGRGTRGRDPGAPGSGNPPADSPRKTSGLWFPFFHILIDLGIWRALSKKATKLYPVICKFADFETGECFPSLRTLSKLSGISLTRIREAVDELVDKGLLTCEKGDSQRSNRYRVVRLGVPAADTRGSVPGSPVSGEATPPASVPGTPVGPPGAQNYTQLTITKVTNTKNNGGGGGDLLEGVGDLVHVIAGELGLKKTGVAELEELLNGYGVEWVGEAFKESVRRGKLTLRYMEGILKNWKRSGRAAPMLRSEADRDDRAARSSEAERERAAFIRRAEEGKKAFERVEQVIAGLPAGALDLLKAEAEVECDRERIPAVVREAMVTSKVRKKVARDYGIQGL